MKIFKNLLCILKYRKISSLESQLIKIELSKLQKQRRHLLPGNSINQTFIADENRNKQNNKVIYTLQVKVILLTL